MQDLQTRQYSRVQKGSGVLMRGELGVVVVLPGQPAVWLCSLGCDDQFWLQVAAMAVVPRDLLVGVGCNISRGALVALMVPLSSHLWK